MPRFEVTQLVRTRELQAIHAVCDGCDPARPCDEHVREARLWLVTAGAFSLRDRRGTHVLDPSRALVMPAGHEFVIRHPAGPDTCVAIHGSLIERLVDETRFVMLMPARAARIAAELAAYRRGEGDELALAEAIADLATTTDTVVRGSRADRDLVAAVEQVVRLDVASPTSLAELADRTGYSLFHACRVFRATTGQTIAGFRRELRLRHALARLLDGDASLAQISSACGFASQSHLTNLFRARYGITPARVRTPAGLAALAA
jgi:AraC family transcriptional regulator